MKVLFKTTYRCQSGRRPIVTCKVNSKGSIAEALEFHVSDKRSVTFQINLSQIGEIEVYGLNAKVLRILDTCPKKGDSRTDIEDAFKSKLAFQILAGESDEKLTVENPFAENDSPRRKSE